MGSAISAAIAGTETAAIKTDPISEFIDCPNVSRIEPSKCSTRSIFRDVMIRRRARVAAIPSPAIAWRKIFGRQFPREYNVDDLRTACLQVRARPTAGAHQALRHRHARI